MTESLKIMKLYVFGTARGCAMPPSLESSFPGRNLKSRKKQSVCLCIGGHWTVDTDSEHLGDLASCNLYSTCAAGHRTFQWPCRSPKGCLPESPLVSSMDAEKEPNADGPGATMPQREE